MHGKAETCIKPLKELNAAEFKYVLDFFQLAIPGSSNPQTKFNTLRYAKSFNKIFPRDYSLGQFLVTLRMDNQGNVQFVNLKTTDNKHIVSTDKFDSPCTVCKNEVLKSVGPLGDGLVCSKCSCYYHNDCAPSPLSRNQIKTLDNSPSNVLLICPICMPTMKSFLAGDFLHSTSAPCSVSLSSATDRESDNLLSKINDVHEIIVGNDTNDSNSLIDLLDSIHVALNSIVENTDLVKIKEVADEQLEMLKSNLEGVTASVNNSMVSIEHWADSVGEKLAHIDKLDIQEFSKKMQGVCEAIDAPKELKLLQKTMEVQFKTFKEEAKKILESKATESMFAKADLEKLSSSISDKLPEQQKLALQDIKANTEKIIDEMKMIPVGVKASNRWDKIEEASTSTKEPNQPWVNVTHSKRAKKPSNVSSVVSSATSRADSRPPKKNLCDEEKTIAVENIKSFDKFVKTSSLTKREFNKHFEKVRIVHSKGIRRGALLIELDSKDAAEEIVKKWKPQCFSEDEGVLNKTTATLLKNKNCRCIITDVDTDHSDEFIRDELANTLNINAQEKETITVRRFVTKEEKRLFTVMVTFSKYSHYEKALEHEQMLIGRSYCPIRKYTPKPYVIQCFNCYQFDHQSAWCSRRKACPYCAQQHDQDNCTVHLEEKTDEYRCVNCPTNRIDASTSRSCPAYIAKINSLQQQLVSE